MVPVFERVFKQIQLTDIMSSSETTMQHIINNVDKNSSYILLLLIFIFLYMYMYICPRINQFSNFRKLQTTNRCVHLNYKREYIPHVDFVTCGLVSHDQFSFIVKLYVLLCHMLLQVSSRMQNR